VGPEDERGERDSRDERSASPHESNAAAAAVAQTNSLRSGPRCWSVGTAGDAGCCKQLQPLCATARSQQFRIGSLQHGMPQFELSSCRAVAAWSRNGHGAAVLDNGAVLMLTNNTSASRRFATGCLQTANMQTLDFDPFP